MTHAAMWLVLTLLGWASTLVLTDVPSAVAYQHLRLDASGVLRVAALVTCGTQVMMVLAFGRDHVHVCLRWCRDLRPRWLLPILAAVLVAFSAIPSAEPAAYLVELAAASVLQVLSLVTLVAAARSLSTDAWDAVVRRVDRLLGPTGTAGPRRVDRWILGMAGASFVVSAGLTWWPYQMHPHLPDEVVYLFHARYLADGMLTMPAVPVPEGFVIDLMHYEPSRWYSPVPPGWPFVLSLGVLAGAPWLVNPVLGAVAVVLTYLLMGRLTDARTTRLTTLLLATSPWFLFVSMSLMTHALSLVCALAAALGIAIARESGRWWPAFVAGIAVGAVSLVRPLEGLISALAMGFWSLAARHRLFRFLPSAALVVGTVASASLVRPYNAQLTGSARMFPIMAFVDKYHRPGSNDLGFGANRGLGWSGLDPFPGHGPIDVVVNSILNVAQVNLELLGWPVGSAVLIALPLLLVGRNRRLEAWMLAAIVAVAGAHAFYWFSGGPDFGARYWYLIIVPCCVLIARSLTWLDERRSDSTVRTPFQSASVLLIAAAMAVYLPWRAAVKYWHYRGMRPDVATMAQEHDFGRSLVLIRGPNFPDYASAVVFNPIDLNDPVPIYAWDANADVRAQLLRAYPDRPVWIVDGPRFSGDTYRIAAGPLTPDEAARSDLPSTGHRRYNPVSPPSTEPSR